MSTYGVRQISREDIENILPHRGHAQMIDHAIYDANVSHRMVGIKEVREDDPWIIGHYPNNPIYPGHCQIECAQLVAALLVYTIMTELDGTPVAVGLDGVRWKEVVRLGDTLRITVDFLEKQSGMYFCKARIINQQGKITTKIKKIIGTLII